MTLIGRRHPGNSTRALRARGWGISFLLLLLGLCALAASRGTASAAGGPTAIDAAPHLTWGFKSSWRNYGLEPQVSGGASIVATPGQSSPYNVEWEFEAGSYDEGTRTTELAYKGSAHWRKYYAEERPDLLGESYTGPLDIYLLDVTVANPRITISAGSSILSAEVTSRENGGERKLVSYGRVPLENLEVLNVTPTVAGGTTSWAGIPTSLTDEGSPAFAGFYRPGQVLDPVSFSYTGAGGAPDFSEHFDREGQPRLKSVENKLLIKEETTKVVAPLPWVDTNDLIAHFTRSVKVGSVTMASFQAFDLEAMEPLGEPFLMTPAEAPNSAPRIVAFDSTEDRLLYHGAGETGITRWLRFNDSTDQYEAGTIADPRMAEAGFLGEEGQGLAWDETLDLGWRVQYVEGAGEWQLLVFKEGADGQWTRKAYPIPDPVVTGETAGPAQTFQVFKPTERTYATASDGSMIVLGSQGFLPEAPSPSAPATIPAAFRLTLDEATESVAVEPLPVTMPNDLSSIYGVVQTAPNGQILLAENTATPGNIVHCQIGDDDKVSCDAPVSVEANVEGIAYRPESFAVDPETGTTWFAGTVTQQVAAFAGGAYLGGDVFAERNPSGGPIVVGHDGTVYMQSNDGGPKEFNGSKTWGWAKLESLGTTATITAQPAPEAVTLPAGVDSESVTFTAAATGTPAPTLLWQRKAPGAARFSDIAGATGATLTVAAEPGMGGTEYRAVFTNTAGRVASAAAELAVAYAPRIGFDLANVTAVEGQSATLSVLASGSPEPTVTWQRRVGGFWESIGPEDENFALEGSSLKVLETNTEQSGSLFRAKFTNAAGTVYSRAAKLTVTPRVSIPEGGVAVTEASLDWLGNEVVQTAPPFGGSNYLSAGVAAPTEASYRSVDGDAAVWQVSSGGVETLATYATRAAHVTDGGEQLVRLYGGTGRIESDGSAHVAWDASFGVNFYGGLVPFTVVDPELSVEPDGDGELTATLEGCASSQTEPGVCTPFSPAAEVVVATFDDQTVEPGEPLVVEPNYDGVAVDVEGSGAEPQLRTGPGWGSWPQSFVDFQLETGLSSYWYSSGGAADADKSPLPFTVNFAGGEAPSTEPQPGGGGEEPESELPGGGLSDGGGSEQSNGAGPSIGTSTGPRESKAKPATLALSKTARFDRRGVAKLASLTCPVGEAACKVVAPERLAKRIGGRRYLLSVSAPARIRAGASAAITVRLSKAARVALAGRRLVLRLPIVVESGGRVTKKVAKVTVVGRS